MRLIRHLDEGVAASSPSSVPRPVSARVPCLVVGSSGASFRSGGSLDQEDNDPARFLSYLAAALQNAASDIGKNALSLLHSPQPPTRALLTDLVNEVAAIPKDFARVLDDYHLIEDEAVHATLAFLLGHLSPQMHLDMARSE